MKFTRRNFIATTGLALAGGGLSFAAEPAEPIIDIHQHTHYGGKRDKQWNYVGGARTDEQLIAHQHLMGITKTILLPAGRPMFGPSTHEGRSNGLESTCTDNDACMTLAQKHPKQYAFGANEVPDLKEAPSVIEKYLKLGAVVIAEQKFGVECDGPEMQRLYQMAADYNVPILMHWQVGSYNYGFQRFYKILEKYPKTNFVGHAQTFWANIDKNNVDNPKNLYPKGKITPGGITDKYLSDYPNMYGDLSAGSCNNSIKRDPEHAKAFWDRHQDKLVFGSDCADSIGVGEGCTGASTLGLIRKLASSKAVERKLLYENAKKLFRL